MRSTFLGIPALWVALSAGCGSVSDQEPLATEVSISDLRGDSIVLQDLGTTWHQDIIVTRGSINGTDFELSAPRTATPSVTLEGHGGTLRAVFTRDAAGVSIAWSDLVRGEAWNLTNIAPSEAPISVDLERLVGATTESTLSPADADRLRIVLPVALTITASWTNERTDDSAARAHAAVETFAATLLPENKVDREPSSSAGEGADGALLFELSDDFEIDESSGGAEGCKRSCSCSSSVGSCSASCNASYCASCDCNRVAQCYCS